MCCARTTPKDHDGTVRAAEDTEQVRAEDKIHEMAEHSDPPGDPLAGTDPDTGPEAHTEAPTT